jgi:hypothetical protein
MKLIKQASGKTTIKMSKKEWFSLGKKAGWLSKKAQSYDSWKTTPDDYYDDDPTLPCPECGSSMEYFRYSGKRMKNRSSGEDAYACYDCSDNITEEEYEEYSSLAHPADTVAYFVKGNDMLEKRIGNVDGYFYSVEDKDHHMDTDDGPDEPPEPRPDFDKEFGGIDLPDSPY